MYVCVFVCADQVKLNEVWKNYGDWLEVEVFGKPHDWNSLLSSTSPHGCEDNGVLISTVHSSISTSSSMHSHTYICSYSLTFTIARERDISFYFK